MLPIRTILCPTDFSELSRAALPFATALARDYHARLVVLHVIPFSAVTFGEGLLPTGAEELRGEAKTRLEELTLPGAGLVAERRLAEGDPGEVILHFARELPADLIVMSTHGRTGLSRMLMGSVTEQVVRHVRCAVLAVRTPPRVEESARPVEENKLLAGPM